MNNQKSKPPVGGLTLTPPVKKLSYTLPRKEMTTTDGGEEVSVTTVTYLETTPEQVAVQLRKVIKDYGPGVEVKFKLPKQED